MRAEVDRYEPVGVPKALAADLWIVDGPVVRMAMYGARIPFPTRATIVRLGDGRLWVHSPTAELPEALARAVEALGPVAHLVSPNRLHYAGVPVWSARWPEARCWASPGVRARAAGQGVAVRFDADLGDAPEAAWAADIDQHVFAGSRWLHEVVFFHRRSRTLILADLIENFEPAKVRGRAFRWLLARVGVLAPDGRTPLDLRATFVGRRAAARASLERLLAWAPERVVLSHGRCLDSDARAHLERAFRWLR